MSSSSIAVIGAGAAGLTAAYLLQSTHRVTLFEKADRLGGHAHTVTVDGAPFDVGFMVLNDRNYPTFHRLLKRLGGIEVRPSEMSFGYQSADGTVQYAINWRPGYAGTDETPVRGPEGKLLGEILRFFRQGTRDLEAGALGDQTFGAWMEAKGLSQSFVDGYAAPIGAAIWSCAPGDLLASPAEFILRFYQHHGMLSIDEGPMWQTIVGGSRRYVEAIATAFEGRVVTSAPTFRIHRDAEGVELEDSVGNRERFDHVVLATHADHTLAMLADPSPEEERLLGAWRYQRSRALLHSDTSVMPGDRGAWASWNYVQAVDSSAGAGPTLTYHLDRLQGQTGLTRPYFLSLNPDRPLTQVHAEFDFEHPLYDRAAVATQPQLRALNGTRRTYFCGNYMGYGFHEDAVKSGAEVAAAFGVTL